MKKTFHHLLPICSRYVLMCWLLTFLHARLSAQCDPDTTPPVLVCPPNQAVLASPGQCSIPVTLEDAVASDNCSGSISITGSMPSGDLFPTGATTVFYVATDAAGNTASCQMTVSVTGNIPRPVCDRWVTLPMDPSGTTTVYPEDILLYGPYDCTQTGVAPDYGVSTPVPSLSFTGTGTYEMYGAVITENGFWEKCWSFVSIVGAETASCTPDATPPKILCRPHYIVYTSSVDCQTVIDLEEPYVSDNCGLATWTSNAPPNNIFTQDSWVVTYTATDNTGNTSTCQSFIEFHYANPILPVCHPLTVTLDASGTAIIYPDDVLAGGPYDCTTRTISFEPGLGAEHFSFLTITEPGIYFAQVYMPNFNGVTHGCSATVTVNPLGCNPESTLPIPNCAPFVTVQTNTQGPGIARIFAETLDNGSTDNCTASSDLVFRVTASGGTTPPTSTYIDISGLVDAYEAFLWVGDQSGNWNNCIVLVSTTPAKCTPDVTKPLVTPPPDLIFTEYALGELGIDFSDPLAYLPQIHAAFGVAYHWDNCDNESGDFQESLVIQSDKIIRRFSAQDAAGNLNDGMAQNILFADGFSAHIPGWASPGEFPDSMTYDGNHVALSYYDQVFASPCQVSPSKIHRNWALADFDFNPPLGIPAILPLLDTDNDGIADPYDIIAIGDSIWLYENNMAIRPLIKRTWSYEYLQVIQNGYSISGTVFIDTLGNCALDAGEPVLKNWRLKAIGQPSNIPYTTVTDNNGVFILQQCPGDTSVEISVDVPFNYAGNCPSTYVLDITGTGPWMQDIPVQLNEDCALLGIDIVTPVMRPCFGGIYAVNFYNYSNQTITDSYVDVVLDPFVYFQSATLPGNLQGANTYRFQTGTLAPGMSGQFKINYVLACNTPMGLTHCTEASIYPGSVCPPAEAWSGAELRVSGSCDGDSVRLNITNIGNSAMAHQLDYVVTEDLIMARTMPYQLDIGGFIPVTFAANGATWRLQSPQEPGHPWGGVVAATVEGCGGLNTPGLVNVFTMDDPDPFSAVDCTRNTGSFDPNDKQAFPQGYDNEHFIERNTDIEYMIRFQNTGTDTAFTVVILDTLSQYLNAGTVRSGASSHDYDFDILEGNVLRFRFDNILLPDSNINEAASHGFIQFRAQQQPGNPMGTVIPNLAAIYFDFNEPVITNETWHTVGENFIEVVGVNNPDNSLGALKVYPNPAAATVFFELPQAQAGRHFELSDETGKRILTGDFPEKIFRFNRGALPAGIYFFRISAESGAVVSGKIVLK